MAWKAADNRGRAWNQEYPEVLGGSQLWTRVDSGRKRPERTFNPWVEGSSPSAFIRQKCKGHKVCGPFFLPIGVHWDAGRRERLPTSGPPPPGIPPCASAAPHTLRPAPPP